MFDWTWRVGRTCLVVAWIAALEGCGGKTDSSHTPANCSSTDSGCESGSRSAVDSQSSLSGVTFLVASLRDSFGAAGRISPEWAYLDHKDTVTVVFDGPLSDSAEVRVSAELTMHRPVREDDLDAPAGATRWADLQTFWLDPHTVERRGEGYRLVLLHPGAVAAGGIRSQQRDEQFSSLRVCVMPRGERETCGVLKVLLPS